MNSFGTCHSKFSAMNSPGIHERHASHPVNTWLKLGKVGPGVKELIGT